MDSEVFICCTSFSDSIEDKYKAKIMLPKMLLKTDVYVSVITYMYMNIVGATKKKDYFTSSKNMLNPHIIVDKGERDTYLKVIHEDLDNLYKKYKYVVEFDDSVVVEVSNGGIRPLDVYVAIKDLKLDSLFTKYRRMIVVDGEVLVANPLYLEMLYKLSWGSCIVLNSAIRDGDVALVTKDGIEFDIEDGMGVVGVYGFNTISNFIRTVINRVIKNELLNSLKFTDIYKNLHGKLMCIDINPVYTPKYDGVVKRIDEVII